MEYHETQLSLIPDMHAALMIARSGERWAKYMRISYCHKWIRQESLGEDGFCTFYNFPA